MVCVWNQLTGIPQAKWHRSPVSDLEEDYACNKFDFDCIVGHVVAGNRSTIS
jgi:hypothetical protein